MRNHTGHSVSLYLLFYDSSQIVFIHYDLNSKGIIMGPGLFMHCGLRQESEVAGFFVYSRTVAFLVFLAPVHGEHYPWV